MATPCLGLAACVGRARVGAAAPMLSGVRVRAQARDVFRTVGLPSAGSTGRMAGI